MRLYLLGQAGLLACLLLATACGRGTDSAAAPAAGQLMQSGFEEAPGWGGAGLGSLTTAKAHGGKVAILTSPEIPFSFTFARPLAELGLQPGAQHLELTGWGLRTAAGSTASLVVQVDASPTDQTKVYYAALPLAEAVPTFGEWKEVRLPVELPANAQGTNLLKIYLWDDKGTTPTYLDDVVLRRVEGK